MSNLMKTGESLTAFYDALPTVLSHASQGRQPISALDAVSIPPTTQERMKTSVEVMVTARLPPMSELTKLDTTVPMGGKVAIEVSNPALRQDCSILTRVARANLAEHFNVPEKTLDMSQVQLSNVVIEDFHLVGPGANGVTLACTLESADSMGNTKPIVKARKVCGETNSATTVAQMMQTAGAGGAGAGAEAQSNAVATELQRAHFIVSSKPRSRSVLFSAPSDQSRVFNSLFNGLDIRRVDVTTMAESVGVDDDTKESFNYWTTKQGTMENTLGQAMVQIASTKAFKTVLGGVKLTNGVKSTSTGLCAVGNTGLGYMSAFVHRLSETVDRHSLKDVSFKIAPTAGTFSDVAAQVTNSLKQQGLIPGDINPAALRFVLDNVPLSISFSVSMDVAPAGKQAQAFARALDRDGM